MILATNVFIATLFSGEKVRFEHQENVSSNQEATSFIAQNFQKITGLMTKGSTMALKDRIINFGGVSMLDYQGGFISSARRSPDAAVLIDDQGRYVGPITDETITDLERTFSKGKRAVLFDIPVAMSEATYVVGTDDKGEPTVVAFMDPRQAQEYMVFKGNTFREIKTYDEFSSSLNAKLKTIPAWSK